MDALSQAGLSMSRSSAQNALKNPLKSTPPISPCTYQKYGLVNPNSRHNARYHGHKSISFENRYEENIVMVGASIVGSQEGTQVTTELPEDSEHEDRIKVAFIEAIQNELEDQVDEDQD
ncbi:hypothetical protein BC939DRAFT_480284 [Gamsiella multidivaricata]|uniref:uncharacterized protein n=1 Tax=Gamsiella multidivaricata TaxID=101098 RepID=UPI002220CB88|nr:uncharacterized protein BC939DRAFT_480284 [Gamsiella multidivaricata]KAI7818501.1 hypothetical protein BC939DRAFT_480284 [Gamsiella multidivaricata]